MLLTFVFRGSLQSPLNEILSICNKAQNRKETEKHIRMVKSISTAKKTWDDITFLVSNDKFRFWTFHNLHSLKWDYHSSTTGAPTQREGCNEWQEAGVIALWRLLAIQSLGWALHSAGWRVSTKKMDFVDRTWRKSSTQPIKQVRVIRDHITTDAPRWTPQWEQRTSLDSTAVAPGSTGLSFRHYTSEPAKWNDIMSHVKICISQCFQRRKAVNAYTNPQAWLQSWQVTTRVATTVLLYVIQFEKHSRL